MTDETDEPGFAPVYVEVLRVRNFRGLADCEVELEAELTLLVGRNNAGKSRLLRALAIALGGEIVDLDDLTVGSDNATTIDVVIAPAPAPVNPEDEEVFHDAIAQRLITVPATREEPLRERFAWRTTIRRSAEGLGARAEMHVLVWDDNSGEWLLPQNPTSLSGDQRGLFSATLVETRRDLVEELGRRGSPIRRILSDLEVAEATRLELEAQLAALGQQIVQGSATLEAIRNALLEVESLVGGLGAPALHALPIRLEELTRTVAIDLDSGTGSLPIRLHGSGARSLASLQLQGVLYDRRLGQDGPTIRPHPVTLVEEPEAHLHPQATLDMAGLLTSMSGQVIASTHSSSLVTAVNPRAIRLVRRSGSETAIVDLGPARDDDSATHRALRPSTHATEMEKLKRLVERPFGELLFGNAMVIGDGATERGFLPPVIRAALGANAHGVCIIDPGSMASDLATAAVKFAKLAGIPWILFSDGDGAGKAAAEALVAAHGDDQGDHVVWVETPNPASDQGVEGVAIERMLVDFDDQLCRNACLVLRPDLPQDTATIQLLKDLKGSVGATLGRKLVEKYPDRTSWPHPLQTLVARLDGQLGGLT